MAPPKPKSSLVREKASSLNDHDAKSEKLPNPVKAKAMSEVETAHTARSSTNSPTKSNAVESPSKEFEESLNRKDSSFDSPPHAAQR